MDNLNQYSPNRFKVVGIESEHKGLLERKQLTTWQDLWYRFRKNKGAITGLSFLIFLALVAVIAPILSPYKYSDQNIRRANLPPRVPVLENISWLGLNGWSRATTDNRGITTPARNMYKFEDAKTGEIVYYDKFHYFGTDSLGRDIWTRVWKGAQISLLIGLIAATIDLFIGVFYGGVSGYFGGKTDLIMQRIAEVLYGIPSLIIIVLFVVATGNQGVLTISLSLALTGWIGMSRVVRSQVLKLKNQEFVLASRTLGASPMRLIRLHLLPNVTGTIIVSIIFTIPSAIFSEAFLSIIGLGIKPPLASLGTLVSDGIKMLQTAPYQLVIPSVVISLLLLSLYLFADGLRDVFDPKMRQ